jgi:hypothetical protein
MSVDTSSLHLQVVSVHLTATRESRGDGPTYGVGKPTNRVCECLEIYCFNSLSVASFSGKMA